MKNLIFWSVAAGLVLAAAITQRTKLAYAQNVKVNPALAEQLLTVERQFWESWKNRKPEVFQQLMADDAVFFGQNGVVSKDEIMNQQKESVGACEVESYALTNARAIAIDENAAILLYEAEQHATCGGVKVQPLMHGSSVYAKRAGKWLNLYRSEVPPAK